MPSNLCVNADRTERTLFRPSIELATEYSPRTCANRVRIFFTRRRKPNHNISRLTLFSASECSLS